MAAPSTVALQAPDTVPVSLRVGAITLVPTTLSRSTDGAPTTTTAVAARRTSRDMSLRAFCFVAETDTATTTSAADSDHIAWYYAPLEDYDRKKLRVDAAAVEHALRKTAQGPAAVYFRLPGSHTFRQLAVARAAPAESRSPPPLAAPTAAEGGDGGEWSASGPPSPCALGSTGIFPSPTVANSPPPLSPLRAGCGESCTDAAADSPVGAGGSPHPVSVAHERRYAESASERGSPVSLQSLPGDEVGGEAAPLIVVLTPGGSSPAASTAVPHCPPRLSAPRGAVVRRRQYRMRPFVVGTAMAVAAAAPAGSPHVLDPAAGTPLLERVSGTLQPLLRKPSNNLFQDSDSASLGGLTKDGGGSATEDTFLSSVPTDGGLGGSGVCSGRGDDASSWCSLRGVLFPTNEDGEESPVSHGSVGAALPLTPTPPSPQSSGRTRSFAGMNAAASSDVRARRMSEGPMRSTARRRIHSAAVAKMV